MRLNLDIPCDGATVVILSRRGKAPSTGRTPIAIEAAGSALHERHTWDQRVDLTTMAAHDSAAHLWQQTSLTRPTWTSPPSTTASAT